MKITRVYTGDDGESHFEDVEVEYGPLNNQASNSELQPATGVIFRKTAGDFDWDFHTAPRRQYVVILQGIMEVEVSDGSTHRINPGEILLAEDTTGKGHITRAVGGPGRSLFIPLE